MNVNSIFCSLFQRAVRFASVLLLIALFSPPTASLAETPYHLDSKRDLWLSGTGAGLVLSGFALAHQKSTPTTDELAVNAGSPALAWDRQFSGQWNPAARERSDTILVLSALAPLPFMSKDKQHLQTIGLMYVETLLITNGAVNVTKNLVTRYRPFSYNEQVSDHYRLNRDVRRSFFSGHAANITGNMVFAATVFSDLNPQSALIPWVWFGAGSVAAYGSWQRVEAGWHFPSDVITGMAWGALVGWSVPQAHRVKRRSVEVMPFQAMGVNGVSMQKSW